MRTNPSTEEFVGWKNELKAFNLIDEFTVREMALRDVHGSRTVRVLGAGPNLFAIARTPPLVGRILTASDAAGSNVALIGEGFARGAFGQIQNAIGKVVVLDNTPFEVVGVLASSFSANILPGAHFDLVIPNPGRSASSVHVIGRLKGGVTRSDAQSELDRLRSGSDGSQPAERRFVALAAPDMLDSRIARMFAAAVAGAAILLVVTCANLVYLLRAYGESGRKNLAVRRALGATTPSLFLWRSVPTVVWTLVGGVGALVLASWTVDALTATAPEEFRYLRDTALRLDTFAFALGLSLIMILVSTGIDLRQSTETLLVSLRSDARSGDPTPGARLAGRLHVTTVIASSLVLAIAAYQVSNTIAKLGRVELGFQRMGLQVVILRLPSWKFRDALQRAALIQNVTERLISTDGLARFALSSGVPLSSGIFVGQVAFEGSALTANGVGLGSVGAGYFALVDQAIVAGREFDEAEVRNGAQVVVLSASAAKPFGSPEQAIGKWVRFNNERRLVIGVVQDTRAPGIVDSLKGNTVYWPWGRPRQTVSIIIRADDARSAQVRSVVASADADVVVEVDSFQTLVDRGVAETRFLALLLGLMSMVAIAMSVSGVYALLSNFIARQRGAIAIRLAVGADSATIQRWVLWKGLSRILPGLAIGLVLSYPFSRLLSTQLFGAEADATTPRLIGALAILAASASATMAASAACRSNVGSGHSQASLTTQGQKAERNAHRPRGHALLLEMTLRERAARARLQVSLQADCPRLVRKLNDDMNLARVGGSPCAG